MVEREKLILQIRYLLDALVVDKYLRVNQVDVNNDCAKDIYQLLVGKIKREIEQQFGDDAFKSSEFIHYLGVTYKQWQEFWEKMV